MKRSQFLCGCGCHPAVAVHPTPTCGCGRPVTPPPSPCGPAPKPKCPPVDTPPLPGTADLPQETAPPTQTTAAVPPWKEGRPDPGSPGEVPWVKGKIKDILRTGAKFGPRKDEFLPYLAIRASAGDRGKRPYDGVFWESPDIYVVPNQEASSAPLMPAALGGVAIAKAPNTLYAHIWNLGKAPVARVRVEFYWFNPSLGISRSSAHTIVSSPPAPSVAYVDLANRFTHYPEWVRVKTSYGEWMSRGCHAIVRCPATWVPSYENNGHECLVVRAFEPILDGLAQDEFAANRNRHVGQRNIAVVQAASPAALDLSLQLGSPESPGLGEVEVTAEGPASMDWLQLYAGNRHPGYKPPAGPVLAGLLPPAAGATRLPKLSDIPFEFRGPLLKSRESFERGCCPLQIAFHASTPNLDPHEAQVFRVRQRLDGELIGGYTVVLLK